MIQNSDNGDKDLEGKKPVLCNDFRQQPAIYKPVFTLDEKLNLKRTSL